MAEAEGIVHDLPYDSNYLTGLVCAHCLGAHNSASLGMLVCGHEDSLGRDPWESNPKEELLTECPFPVHRHNEAIEASWYWEAHNQAYALREVGVQGSQDVDHQDSDPLEEYNQAIGLQALVGNDPWAVCMSEEGHMLAAYTPVSYRQAVGSTVLMALVLKMVGEAESAQSLLDRFEEVWVGDSLGRPVPHHAVYAVF